MDKRHDSPRNTPAPPETLTSSHASDNALIQNGDLALTESLDLITRFDKEKKISTYKAALRKLATAFLAFSQANCDIGMMRMAMARGELELIRYKQYQVDTEESEQLPDILTIIIDQTTLIIKTCRRYMHAQEFSTFSELGLFATQLLLYLSEINKVITLVCQNVPLANKLAAKNIPMVCMDIDITMAQFTVTICTLCQNTAHLNSPHNREYYQKITTFLERAQQHFQTVQHNLGLSRFTHLCYTKLFTLLSHTLLSLQTPTASLAELHRMISKLYIHMLSGYLVVQQCELSLQNGEQHEKSHQAMQVKIEHALQIVELHTFLDHIEIFNLPHLAHLMLEIMNYFHSCLSHIPVLMSNGGLTTHSPLKPEEIIGQLEQFPVMMACRLDDICNNKLEQRLQKQTDVLADLKEIKTFLNDLTIFIAELLVNKKTNLSSMEEARYTALADMKRILTKTMVDIGIQLENYQKNKNGCLVM